MTLDSSFSDTAIELLVHEFYARVRDDEVLGPIFDSRIENWPHHLGRMVGFWKAVLRGEPTFKPSDRGSPPRLHQQIPRLTHEHFDRWLERFGDVAAGIFPPSAAVEVVAAAQRIAVALSRHLPPTKEGRVNMNEKNDGCVPTLVVDGRSRARAIVDGLANRAANVRRVLGRSPRLEIIRIGEDRAQDRYASKKVAAGHEVGIDVVVRKLGTATMADAMAALSAVGDDSTVDAIFLQYPLPGHLDDRALFDAIPLEKDVDCASSRALGELIVGRHFAPANVSGLLELFTANNVGLTGQRVLIASLFVGISGPLTALLVRAGASVAVVSTIGDALSRVASLGRGDVFVSCFGCAGEIDGQAIPRGLVVVDGAYFHPTGGDICVEDDGQRFSLWIPPRHSLGPMTIACLLRNTVRLAETRSS